MSHNELLVFTHKLRSFHFGCPMRKRLVCDRLWSQRMELSGFEITTAGPVVIVISGLKLGNSKPIRTKSRSTCSDSKMSDLIFFVANQKAILNLKKYTTIQNRSSYACFITARKWCIILPTSFYAYHRPVVTRVQQSPLTKMRLYVSRLVSNIANNNVRSVLCAQAQAFQPEICSKVRKLN